MIDKKKDGKGGGAPPVERACRMDRQASPSCLCFFFLTLFLSSLSCLCRDESPNSFHEFPPVPEQSIRVVAFQASGFKCEFLGRLLERKVLPHVSDAKSRGKPSKHWQLLCTSTTEYGVRNTAKAILLVGTPCSVLRGLHN